MSLIEQLTQTIGGEALEGLSKQLGMDQGTTSSAVTAALPMLIGALSKNTSRQQGAHSLERALAEDHDGSILNNLSGFLGQEDNGPGAGILKHLFGQKRQGVERGLGEVAGIDSGMAGKLLENLAPVLMGFLGKQRRQQGMNAGMLANLLNNEAQQTRGTQGTQSTAMNLVTSLLDQDGDGSMIDDAIGMIGKFMR